MSDNRQSSLFPIVALFVLVILIFLFALIVDSELRDLQRRVGTIEASKQ